MDTWRSPDGPVGNSQRVGGSADTGPGRSPWGPPVGPAGTLRAGTSQGDTALDTALDQATIDGFDVIDLAGLNRRAALLDREENKYVLGAAELSAALVELHDEFDILDISGVRDFSYDTVYFDTDDLLTYRQHAQGRRQRMKVRSRRYDDSDNLCWFEVKLKGTRGRTVKRRLAYSNDIHGTLTPEAMTFVAQCVHQQYGADFVAPMRPALAMCYRRFTLVGRTGSERITIDHNLQFRSGSLQAPAPTSTVIVEVKSPDGHGRADELMRSIGRRPEPCSKYCVGLNLVAAPVTHNSFNRTLRRHFDWEAPAVSATITEPTVVLDQQGDPAAIAELADLVDRVARRLVRQHPDRAEPVVRMAALAAATHFADASVRSFLEVLTFRRADEALRAVDGHLS